MRRDIITHGMNPAGYPLAVCYRLGIVACPHPPEWYEAPMLKKLAKLFTFLFVWPRFRGGVDATGKRIRIYRRFMVVTEIRDAA